MQEVFELVVADAIPDALREYGRAASMLELLQLGLPTQEGIIVTSLSDLTKERILSYLIDKDWKMVLVRSDKQLETDRDIMRGGYLISLGEVFSETQRLLNLGRIVLLLQPTNKYENLYGINILINSDDSPALIEIVGHGFDVTDINRGDISPHETIELDIKDKQVTTHILRRETISASQYTETVKARLTKIGKEIMARRWAEAKPYTNDELEKIGLDYLKTSGYRLLLDSAKEYSSLPNSFLRRLVSFVKDLPWRLPTLEKREREYVISASVIGTQSYARFVFWDIVRPSAKYYVESNVKINI